MDFNPNEDAGNPGSASKKPFPMKMVGYLSNLEVYDYFKEIKDVCTKNEDRATALKSNTHLSTVVYEALQYFKQTPCAFQSSEGISEFVRRMKPYGLTKLEQLTMINTRPVMPVDIQAVIEESEERLTDEQVEEIISIVEECLPTTADEALRSIKQEPDD